MRSRRAIRTLATCAAVAATVVSLAAAVPAAADADRYGNSLTFRDASFADAPCNPDRAVLHVVGIWPTPLPLFRSAVAWVDFFGIPVGVSAPFRIPDGSVEPHVSPPPDVTIPFPSASKIPRGVYTMHVLLQGNGQFQTPLLYFVFTTVSDAATIAPGLNTDCTPITIASAATASAATAEAATRKPSRAVLARRVKAMRRDSDTWFERPHGARAKYPKARFCAQTVCVQRRAGADWKPVAR